MSILNNIREWTLVVPTSYCKLKNLLTSFLPNKDKIKILIVDDIDADGFSATKITKVKLSKIFPSNNIDIHINDKHGFTDLKYTVGYDLVIIVDSSSNLLELYQRLPVNIIVIDHHEYDHNQTIPANVTFINSKDTSELKSVSAGMLCYLLFTQFLLDMGIDDEEDLFDLACMSLYSDLVPNDEYVCSCLLKLLKVTKYSKCMSSLNIYKSAINKNTFQFTIIPLINYTRRLLDKNTLQLLYSDNEHLATPFLLRNKEQGKDLLDIIAYLNTLYEYEAFIHCDITDAIRSMPHLNIASFKGVYANKLQEKYRKPVIISFTSPQDGQIYFSVRSENIDSLTFMKGLDIDGGGHKNACGFHCSPPQFNTILTTYNSYVLLRKVQQIIPYVYLPKLSCLDSMNMFDLAVRNELLYSVNEGLRFRLPQLTNDDITNIDMVKLTFTIHGHNFKSYETIKDYNSLVFKPSLTNYNTQTYKLLCSKSI